MKFGVEVSKRVNGEITSSYLTTEHLDLTIGYEVEINNLGNLLAQTKGVSGKLLFENGSITYQQLKDKD